MRNLKKNLRKLEESWERTSGTTKWDKLGQVRVLGTSGTRRRGSSDLSRGNMGKITQFRGWFSNLFLNVESPTAPIDGSRTSQQTRVRRCVETVRLIVW